MSTSGDPLLSEWLARLRAGDESARAEVLRRAQEQLRRIASKMLASYPTVRRFEETDDVLQKVLLRLDRALRQVTLPSAADLLRLAAAHTRRELIDLCRRYRGPHGLGANHATPRPGADGEVPAFDPKAPTSCQPDRLDQWEALHLQIAALPAEEREVFDLLWYNQLPQAEAAELLGISLSTLKRRWVRAQLHLAEALGGEIPS